MRLRTFTVAAVLAAMPVSAAGQTETTSAVNPQKSPNPVVIDPAKINVLKSALAEYSGSLKSSPPVGFWVQNWTVPDQFFRWAVSTPKSGQYAIDVLVSGEPGTVVQIAGPRNKLNVTIPDGNDVWGNNWNRLPAAGSLTLPEGRSVGAVSSPAPKGVSTSRLRSMALLSLELVNVAAKKDLDARVRRFRSSTKWFADAKYGVFLQWGEWGYPAHGDKKKWPQMIDDLDVEKFADTMQEIGAGYVIWSATWRTHYFPAPIKAIDNILPGRTSQRDLIGDLIGALGRRGIKLILYYHCGRGDKEWQARNWGKDEDPNNWGVDPVFRKHWGDIVTEVGLRYGKGLAGWRTMKANIRSHTS